MDDSELGAAVKQLSTAVENWTDAALEKWTPLTIGE